MGKECTDLYSMPSGNCHLDELAAPGPVDTASRHRATRSDGTILRLSNDPERKDEFINLNEIAASPVDNPQEHHRYRHEFLEEQHSREDRATSSRSTDIFDFNDLEQPPEERVPVPAGSEPEIQTSQRRSFAPRIVTELYILSYLIIFSIFGTLARLGLQVLTSFPGTPITTSEIWANVGGSLIMGYLSEDRQLFKTHIRRVDHSIEDKAEKSGDNTDTGGPLDQEGNQNRTQVQAAKDHMTMKKSIPLYIGLTTGFCGSFTSFSSFIRDVFLQLADQPVAVKSKSAASGDIMRGGGNSAMAVIAVIFFTIALSISALKIGAHLAILFGNIDGSLPSWLTSKAFNRFIVLLAPCMWVGAIAVAIWPPNDQWRGQVLFALVFAPTGTILRFYTSMVLNGVIGSFPLGTFTANVFGTAVLGMSWNLQRAPLSGMVGGGRIGCQVLQGVQDGFCGCLTTVSTWVLELVGLRRGHAYVYGGLSTAIAVAFLVAIMGSLLWSRGFGDPACII
ncbi:hypothetical protein EG329_011630 [Mollisiaceae sp. DMI_Dod_QoI]|nr:hypothetical protein EG329_011630 [Helotiales sp. DMI_Dod_QoI]